VIDARSLEEADHEALARDRHFGEKGALRGGSVGKGFRRDAAAF
jgi:hypothetical protein